MDLTAQTVLQLQRDQFRHDKRNHFDIICLPKEDRLKHYGLHFAKYVGRIARSADTDGVRATVVDTGLVCLSAANTLHQRLDLVQSHVAITHTDSLRWLADAAGRFADACEKQDHLESFLEIANVANSDIFKWVASQSDILGLNLEHKIAFRRKQLADRHFYIEE